jgi:hypothetical protein
MRRLLVATAASLILLASMTSMAAAGSNSGTVKNAHCVGDWRWVEGKDNDVNYAYAAITFSNTGDPYAQCTSLTVQMKYTYYCWNPPFYVCSDTAVKSVFPGDYPYDKSSYTAAVYKSSATCTSVHFTVRVYSVYNSTGWMSC